eukprot:14357900-Alexandrium_andersonii.AAC.1
MVLNDTWVMVGEPTSAQTRTPKLSRGPFCAVVRAERKTGNGNLSGTPQGSLCAVARAGHGR